MQVRLSSEVSLPKQYRNTVIAALRTFYEQRKWEMRELFGLDLPFLTDDDLLRSMLAESLASIAYAAAGQRQHDEVEDNILAQGIQSVCEAFFASPFSRTYHVPTVFWEDGVGAMIARALLWLHGDDLITIAEAARMRGVSPAAISQAIAGGRLRRYIDPDAPARQGHVLVSRREVESM